MATHVLTDVDFYINQYDVASYVNSVDVTAEAENVDFTNFGSGGWKESKGGLKTGAFGFKGFASFGVGELSTILEPLDGLIGTTGVIVSVSPSNTENEPALTMSALSLSWNAMGQIGAAAPFEFKSVADGNRGVLAGRLIAAKASRTTSTTSTGYQLGAVSATQRIYSALHVFSASGSSPTLDLIVQSDDNSGFSSATTRITHTQRTAAGYELSSLAGAVTDDYWRASWTIGGSSTPTFSFAHILAITNV